MSLIEYLKSKDAWGTINSIYNEGLCNPIAIVKLLEMAKADGINIKDLVGYEDLVKSDYREVLK